MNCFPSRSLFLIFALLLPVSVAAQGRSTVTGFVFGPDRKPIERARVELSDGTSAFGKRVETDTSGRFVINNVGIGRLELRVIAPGSELEEYSQSVEIGGGGTGGFETVQVDVRMKLRKGSAASAAASVVFAQDVPEAAKKHFQNAVADFEKKQPAIAELEKAVAVFPTYFAALEMLGVEYMKVREYEKAKTTFTTAVAVNSRSFNGWYGLSYADLMLEHDAEALEAATKAIEIDKSAPEAYYVVGMSQRKLKDYNASEKAFLKAKEFDKGRTPEIHWNLALLYAHNLQQYGKAADELEFFLKSTPDNPDTAQIKKLIANFRSKQLGSK